MPLADMTLIAGDKGFEDPFLDSLLGPSDQVVPVDSAFCRTTDPNDGKESLLKVHPGNKITEVTDEFTHTGFSTDEYRIIDHDQIYIPIQQGLSDWVVGKSLVSNVVKYDDFFTVASADFQVEAQHNVWDNTYDRVVPAIYAMDTDNNWHVKGDYVNESGNVIKSEPIEANSKDQPTRTLQTNVVFAQDENI